MRKMVLGAGWKMHKNTLSEVSDFVDVVSSSEHLTSIETFLLPSFVFLPLMQELLMDSPIKWGAQTMAFVDYGAYTGEVSVTALKEFGCRYVEIGHAERREHFNETNHIVNLKTKLALEHGMAPVLCIGETKQEKEQQIGDDVIKEQVQWACKDVNKEDVARIIFAYEPVWAIGQQEGADEAYVQKQHRLIRNEITRLYDKETAEQTRIIYGGSVKLDNANAYVSQPDVDGLFVGRFALDPDNFIGIAKIISSVIK